ncbi:hypothetical protein [Archangium sp.]|uniref:hypothetical protein n=1 Tax=Archangium sp. TaxID=1872627 RepID=UPI002D758048|nr:hypothetical protein [Archangium sp.]HYO51164.1 hypothetical protein [Archangium sp.]
MSLWVALLFFLFLVGCGGATRGLRPSTGQHTFRYSGMHGNTAGQGVSGEGLGQSLPRAVLEFVPQGATTAAEAGTATATGEALVAGGAVVAAGGSVVLVCLTVKAALNGMRTPIDIADTFYGTHFGDLQGWVQGCYAPKVAPGAPTPTAEVKPVSEPHAPPASGRSPEAHEDRDKKNWGRIYATYTKFNSRTGRYYTGRTSMVIDLNKPLRPQAVAAVNARDSNHHIDEDDEPKGPGFRPALLDAFDVGTSVSYANRYSDVAYWRIRGREQQLIDSLGGAQSDTQEPYRTENVQRGVAKDNPPGRLFHDAATKQWGQLHPYTGA